MTSNLGSSYLLEGINESGEISEDARKSVDMLLKSSFKPEFLNRLDEIIYFKPLTKEDMRSITDLQFRSLKERVKAQGIDLDISDKAKDYIIDNSYDPLYGARPIKRFIQNNLETLIARYILSHELELGDRIYVDSDGTDLTVSQS